MILKTLEEERKLADSGALKMNSKWISAPDREANAFEIDASILMAEMKDAADAGRYQTAMRTFEKIDRDYRASDSFEKAVGLAKEVLASYKPQLTASIKQVDSLIPQRKAELERLSASQQKAAYDEIARRDKAYEALVESGRFMGGFNLALSLFNVALLFNWAGFETPQQWALVLLFNSVAHGSQFAGNVPMFLQRIRQ